MKDGGPMFGIMLRFSPGFIVFPFLVAGTEPPSIHELTRDFEKKTRTSYGSLPPSTSLYHLEEVRKNSDYSLALQAYDTSGAASSDYSDSEDEYTERIGETFKQLQEESEARRKFNTNSLVHFIMQNQGVDEHELDINSMTFIDHLSTIEDLINLSLEAFEGDLKNALLEKSAISFSILTDTQEVTTRHKRNLQTINKTLKNISDNISHLIFSYYSSTIAGLLYKYCQPKTEDSQEIWQKKSLIFTTNLQIHLLRFNDLFLNDFRSHNLRRALQKNLECHLINFFIESCSFFKYWYEHNRSALTQSLHWLGARDSGTKEKFSQFTRSYPILFDFLYDNAVNSSRLNVAKEETLNHFKRVDNNFSEGVSTFTSLLGWSALADQNGQPVSSSTSTPSTKSTTSWGGWW